MTPRRQVTIAMLPDDALFKIFDFFVDDNDRIEALRSLVHVCRKWRNIVFEPPRLLYLHLHCPAGRPQAVRELLDIWPDLPIVIKFDKLYDPPTLGVDSTVTVATALAHTDRDCEISLGMFSSSLLEVIPAAMQVPFPASMRLKFLPGPIAPNSFLGGPVPHPRSLGLPNQPLSSSDLVRLTLRHIPHSAYIPPEAMVTCLETLTKLEFFGLEFESPRSYPDPECQCQPLPTRSVLPALTRFEFRGVSEYMEVFVARVNAPLLEELYINFFNQLILDTPHLAHFIDRTPKLKPHIEAQVMFLDDAVQILLGCMQGVILRTRCQPSDWQVSFVAGVSHSFLSLVPELEHLFICEGIHSRSRWQVDIENSQWMELLHPFTNVKNLYLSEGVVPRIAPALQEVVEGRVTEVLPGLERLFLEESHPSGPVQDAIGMFIAERKLSMRPTNSHNWKRRGTSVFSQRFTGLVD